MERANQGRSIWLWCFSAIHWNIGAKPTIDTDD